MKPYLKSFFQKWPVFYRFLQGIYHIATRIIEVHILGTKFQELAWQNRSSNNTRSGFLESLEHPHREFLVNTILSRGPIESVLEVGCSSGVNLGLLALKNQTLKLHGIDINKKAIEVGTHIMKDMGFDNVTLSCTKADSLALFGDKSMDIVFTDAVLLYVGPDKIDTVINGMVRIARKALIFTEWHRISPDGREHIHGHWVYDYRHLLSKYAPPQNIKFTKITRDIWDNDVWSTLGHIVELNVEKL